MDDLTCNETISGRNAEPNVDEVNGWAVIKAHADPVLLSDDRVIQNMLFMEDQYLVNMMQATDIQGNKSLPYMRREVASWMLGVCEDQMCQEDVFPLAMNYMDRFLCLDTVHPSLLQLLGTTCLFISSKLRESKPLIAEKLCAYTDFSITLKDIQNWEIIVLNKLKWDVSAIIASDFLHHILIRLPISQDHRLKIKSHAMTFISLCAMDMKFSMYPASMIAAATIAVATDGLNYTTNEKEKQKKSQSNLLKNLQTITGVEDDCLRESIKLVEEMVSAYIASAEQSAPTELSKNEESLTCKPKTPTDIQDIHF